ncbi:MAG TPA: hypothetical protein VLJ18_07690 [Thermoanaerobaculia bacterium]|nr:hypothetical protein [Thermoanaerobaculia bacterium]HSB64031.1 hypothetical protein [Thermoanaerobaculia bacterium]
MLHVLVATLERHDLLDGLRALAPATTTFLGERGLEAILERLGRSARMDAVVTDAPEVLMEIYHEIPGAIPVYLARPDEDPAAVLAGLEALIATE